jgi:pimeloyl-ACP methyl ester carboxylesterase
MHITAYPCPLPGGAAGSEFALALDRDRQHRLLVLPALFDEANRMRRFSVEVMRRLDGAGIDSFLPDLPGCNESLRPLAEVEAEDWAMAAEAATAEFGASHVLAIRGGALFVPKTLPGWSYGAVKGASLLRTMLRARVLAAREAGREENLESLIAEGLGQGLELAGHRLSADMFARLHELAPGDDIRLTAIDQDLIGGSPLWLRAEPDEDADQADALAAVIAMALKQ